MRYQESATGLGTVALFANRWELEAQAEIRTSFLGMAKHLRGRPKSYKSPFDEAGGARQTPGWAVVRAARACLDAAEAKGEATLAATRKEVHAYCAALEAAMLHGYEPTGIRPEIAIVDFAREASEATTAATRYAVSRDPLDAAAVRKEVREASEAAVRVLSLGDRLALPTHPRPHSPVGAVR